MRVLGGFELEGVAGSSLGSRKARLLLRSLALARGRPVSADTLADRLWGDTLPARPAVQVSVLVSRLRRVLGPGAITRTDAGYALALTWLDVDELAVRTEEAVGRLAAGETAAAAAAAAAALKLVRGEVLAGDDGDWIEPERAAAQRLVARVRLVAAGAALAAGEPGGAAAAAARVLDHDPYDEAALRLLMRAHVAAGRPASALAAYAELRRRVSEELGVDLSPETEALHTEILLSPSPGPPAPPAGSWDTAAGEAPVGRDEVMGRLRAVVRTVAGGPGRLVVVEGEAGIGKSTVLASLLGEARRSGATVLAGSCDELGRELPFQPVLEALTAHLGGLAPEESEHLLGPSTGVLSTVLSRGPVDGPTATVLSDQEAGRSVLLGGLLGVLDRLPGAVRVLAVEDVHRAGPATLELLQLAARRVPRLLVAVTRRPEGADLPAADLRVPLGPLERAAVAEIVGEERADELLRRSGGNPLFLNALAGASPGESLPATLQDLVAARADQLGGAGATLMAAAVIGPEIDLDLLASVLDVPAVTLLDHVDLAVRAGLVQERGTSYVFRHDLVREALDSTAGAARRAYLHRRAANVLTGRPDHEPLAAAHHARMAGDGRLAARSLVEAARIAASRFDLAEAERLLDDAVALSPEPEVLVVRGRVRMARWGLDQAAEDAERAVAAGGGAEALELAGWVAYYQRDLEAAGRLADEGAARSVDPGLRASCLALGGRVRHSAGDLGGAERLLVEAAAIATPAARGLPQVWLAGLQVHLGDIASAVEMATRALLEPERLGHPFAYLHGGFARVVGLGMQGRVAEAMAATDWLAEAARERGLQGKRFGAVADNVRAWLLRGVGLVAEADAAAHRALDALAGPGSEEPARVAGLELVDNRLAAGDAAGAAAALARITGGLTWQGTMAWHQHHRYRLLAARVALVGGDATAAEAEALAAADEAQAVGNLRYALYGRLVAALARSRSGHPVDADAVDADMRAFEDVGGLECWWITADLAAVLDQPRWRHDAAVRIDRLVEQAGLWAESLRVAASRRSL